jgi:hypothetical protein
MPQLSWHLSQPSHQHLNKEHIPLITVSFMSNQRAAVVALAAISRGMICEKVYPIMHLF